MELAKDSLLILDENADEKSGIESADALRQYNGRMGKVDENQVPEVHYRDNGGRCAPHISALMHRHHYVQVILLAVRPDHRWRIARIRFERYFL